ncbi:MAG: membrane lipoprotein lipid attachment site-containing protein [Chitinophagales bacterium]|nr:membrane lipoprotein lipid attachment site-containing protein [Chitinophagaceae bacterium]MCB9065202.1 membrane lipoprotein lipid attachment site-containing protein [Chitinophagales bacterium]
MKRTLIALTAILFLAACQQKTEEAKTDNEVSTTMNEEGGVNPALQEALIPEQEGNNMIQAYHDYLINNEGISREDLQEKHLSFLINAEALRSYLNDNPTYTDMVFYLAMDGEQKLTLVYIGAERDSMNVIVEKPFVGPDGSNYLFDRAYPCPTCDRISVHNGNQ